jgi:succinate dehydrogenase / fumarate reductase membrane anchor subunit
MALNRTVVGAHYGVRGWLVQRLSAVVMGVTMLFFLLALLAARPGDYATWKGLFSQGWVRVAALLFFLSLFSHAWVGMRDILMDYVKPTGVRLGLQLAVILALVAGAVWATSIVWRA